MPEEPQEIRSINWREVFKWTHLFRGFRMAYHPSKLIFAVAALVALWLFGWLLDVVWDKALSQRVSVQYLNSEMSLPAKPKDIFKSADLLPVKASTHEAAEWMVSVAPPPAPAGKKSPPAPGLDAFRDNQKMLATRRQNRVAELLTYFEVEKDEHAAQELAKTDLFGSLDKVKEKISTLYQEYRKDLEESRKKLDELTPALEKKLAEVPAEPAMSYADRKKTAEKELENHKKKLQAIDNVLNYKAEVARKRVHRWIELQKGEYISEIVWQQVSDSFATMVDGVRDLSPAMVAYGAQTMLLTPVWLVKEYTFYGLLYLAFALVVFSLAGGAICRIAAVEFARDEQIWPTEAAMFAWKKAVQLIICPLIPLVIVGLIVGITFVVAMLMNVPYVGEVLTSLLFFLALLGGLIMALVLIGTVAGVGLMHPTIAAEGSDAFDGISRSFSYVFGKPWTTAWYAVVSVAYGAVSYIFARFFVWFMLWLTHTSVNLGLFPITNRPADVPADAEDIRVVSKFEAMWASPTFDKLFESNTEIMYRQDSETLSSAILAFWVGVVLFSLSGFIVSFAYCQLTIMYFLLRHQVDATEMDDVYIEEPEDEFAEMTSPAAPAATTAKSGEAPKPKIDLPLAPTPTAGAAPPPPAPPPPAPTTFSAAETPTAPPPPPAPVTPPVAETPPAAPPPPTATASAAETPAAPPPPTPSSTGETTQPSSGTPV